MTQNADMWKLLNHMIAIMCMMTSVDMLLKWLVLHANTIVRICSVRVPLLTQLPVSLTMKPDLFRLVRRLKLYLNLIQRKSLSRKNTNRKNPNRKNPAVAHIIQSISQMMRMISRMKNLKNLKRSLRRTFRWQRHRGSTRRITTLTSSVTPRMELFVRTPTSPARKLQPSSSVC